MDDTARYRSFMLTGNNPEKLIDEIEIDYSTATDEDYTEALYKLVDRFVKGDVRHNDRNPEINGCMATWERGEAGGQYHVHVWCTSKNPIAVSVIREKFPHFHIDVVAAKEAREVEDYITKAGKHADKKSTQIVEPVKWGEYFCTNSDNAGTKLYEDLVDYVKAGMTPSQIILADPRFSMHEQMVHSYYGAYTRSRIKPIRKVKTVYRTGEVGAGKSYTYVKLCQEHGEENVYLVSGASSTHGSFDEYASEKYLVIDELRADTYRWPELLTLLDGYKRQLPARYKNKFAAWEEVHICTVVPPETLFAKMRRDGKTDELSQLLRRLDSVVYHFKDARYEGGEAYRTVSVKVSEYEGIDQLRLMAEKEKRMPIDGGVRALPLGETVESALGDDCESSSQMEVLLP